MTPVTPEPPADSFDSPDGRTYSEPVTAATPGPDSCGCPETDGKTYHQRGTCTDPAVSALDWYADGPAQQAATPGQAGEVSAYAQAAFDAFWASPALGEEPSSPLTRESAGIRNAWERAVGAVLKDAFPGLRRELNEARAAVAAQDARPAPGYGKRDPLACPCCVFGGDDCWCRADCGVERCQAREVDDAEPKPVPAADLEAAFASGMRVRTAPCTADAHDREHFQVRTNGHWLCGHLLASMLAAQGITAGTEAQPAPELPYTEALVSALNTKIREAEADRDDYAARLKAVDQSWSKLAAERDKLRELLDEIGVMAANAPEDGDSFGLLEEIALRIAAAGVEGK